MERVLLLELHKDTLVMIEQCFAHHIVALNYADQTYDVKISCKFLFAFVQVIVTSIAFQPTEARCFATENTLEIVPHQLSAAILEVPLIDDHVKYVIRLKSTT